MSLLTDQVCIVSGAGQGLGRAVAMEMAREGAKVVLLERNPETVRQVATEISRSGGRAEPHHLDVTNYEAYGKVVADTIEKFGRIDAIVNNAAINPPAKTILDDNLDDWRRTIQINLEAVYMGSKLVAPYMAERKEGRIINIASIQGFAASGEVLRGFVRLSCLSFVVTIELIPHRMPFCAIYFLLLSDRQLIRFASDLS